MSETRRRRVCALDDVALAGIGGLRSGTPACQVAANSGTDMAVADRRRHTADDMSRIATGPRDQWGGQTGVGRTARLPRGGPVVAAAQHEESEEAVYDCSMFAPCPDRHTSSGRCGGHGDATRTGAGSAAD